jgi:hypothetical protein
MPTPTPKLKPTSTVDVLRAHAQRLTRRADQITELINTLDEANDLCRSCHSVAQRKGEGVNWPAIEKRLGESLKRQHKVMHGAGLKGITPDPKMS